MKEPLIQCILVSHDKPGFVETAMRSVRWQTYENWRLLVIDSGKLLEHISTNNRGEYRVEAKPTNEPEELAKRVNPHSWVVNQAFRDRVFESAELLVFICDDDWFYPWAFQAFADFYREAPGRECMYGHVHLGRSDARGVTSIFGARMADVARGKACNGPKMDCQVDYLQFCFSRVALEKYREKWGPEILSERLEDKGHADGIFMERMGELFPVYAVPAWIGMNRRTPLSVNCGT